MGKIWVEVCLISARGLRHTSSLWKLQWFAVGWIDPNNKYCTKVDASGKANPVWKTKFAALVDDSQFEDMALHVEVYSREPIFLRERLQGTATIVLKEFLSKYSKNVEASRPGTEEVGSYQLRRRNSSKPQGFVDVSIRISEEKEDSVSFPGSEDGVVLMDHSSNNMIIPSTARGGGGGSGQAYPSDQFPLPAPKNQSSSYSYPHPMPYHPPSYSNPPGGGSMYPPAGGPGYPPPPRTPPPPPPPSNVGYIPTFLPNTDIINMPSSVAATGRGPRPGLAMGLGAGALAAGAVIFGDDFMSGFNIPSSLQDPSLTISADRPF